VFGTASVADSLWHDFKLEVTDGVSALLTVDGSAAGSQTGSYPGFDSLLDAAAIGAFFASSASAAFFFTGQIDEQSLWYDVDSGAEPTTPYSTSATHLQALWHFDSDVVDSKGATGAPTSAALSGPTTGATGAVSAVFTITIDAPATGTITFTPAGTVGSVAFSPASPQITAGNSTVTFTATPSIDGAHVISITNSGGLVNANTLTYTTSSAVIYDRVDATDPIGGQSIMVLVPNSNSANPYNSSNPTKVIYYSHGVGEDQTALLSDSLKTTVVTALLNAGYILAGTNAHGNNFGVQSAVDDYAALDKYVRANYNVVNVAIWSQSMGGLTGLLLLAQNKVRGCVGWLGTYPITSLNAAYTGAGAASFTSSINTAYGITGIGNSTYANKTYGHDPLLMNAIAFRNVPMRFYASTGDTVVLKSANTDLFQALISTSCRENVIVACTGDHGDPSHFDATSYVDFFDRCFATVVATSGIAAGGTATSTRTISVTLTDASNVPLINLTGLKVAWFDQSAVSSLSAPTYQTSGATTNSSGVLSVTSISSRLSPGGTGLLAVSSSTGDLVSLGTQVVS
jgi:hypothetical protein